MILVTIIIHHRHQFINSNLMMVDDTVGPRNLQFEHRRGGS
jgi:hypothetical protein